MAQNRLMAFARKPAPVQTTYLCNQITTGLSTIDYRISDRHVDPPSLNDAFYSEKIILLPDCYLCFQPPPDSPPVRCACRRLANRSHHHSAASTIFRKVTPQVLDLWSQLLCRLAQFTINFAALAPLAKVSMRVLDHFRPALPNRRLRHQLLPPRIEHAKTICNCTIGWTSIWTPSPMRGTPPAWMRFGWACP